MFDQVVTFCAQYLPFVSLAIALIFIAGLEKLHRVSAVILFTISAGVAFIADKILNRLIESPRPFMVNDIAPLFEHSSDNGFPSEHVLLAILIASVIFIYNRRLGYILAILALIIGSARVIANVHHPIDVLGGAAIGMISVFCVYLVLSSKRVRDLLHEKCQINLINRPHK